jgi:hypothetical protein
MGIVPSTCNCGLGLMLAPLMTSRPRYLVTLPVEPLIFYPPSPRVLEMRSPTLCSTMHPQESWLLITSRPDIHMRCIFLALPSSQIICATCIPLAPRYGPHCSSCRDIAISQPRDPRGQILRPFLARSRDTIPRSDPTILLCSESNGSPYLATSRPCDLEYPMFGLSTCEFSSSQDPLISRHLSSSYG